MDNKRSEKLSELLSDEEFMITLLSQDNKENVKALFSHNEIELSDNDINTLGGILLELLNKDEKLSDKDLELISGGTNFPQDSEESVLDSNIIKNINLLAIKSRKSTLKLGDWVKTFKI